MALDRDVFGDFGIPIDATIAERRVGQGPHYWLRCAVSQFGAGVDDLLKGARKRDVVFFQKGVDRSEVLGDNVGIFGIGAEAHNLATDEYLAARHVFANPFTGITQDDQAAAIHHVTGKKAGLAAAQQCARFHHLSGAGTDIAFDDHFATTQGNASNGTGIAAHHHRSGIHRIADAPADIGFDFEIGAMRQPGAKIARRTLHLDAHRCDQADADVMAGVGIGDFDVVAARGCCAHGFVGFANRSNGKIYRDHVWCVPGAGSVVARGRPGKSLLRETSSEAMATRVSSSYMTIGLAARRSLA